MLEDWKTADGKSFEGFCRGPMKNVVQEYAGGLRSAMAYVGAKDLKEFRAKAEFIRISPNSVIEGTAHYGK